MDLNTALFIVQDTALLITIIGWIVTGSQQQKLIRETRKYERLDRDLAMYRARMDRASEFTRALMDASDKWNKLSVLAKALIDEGLAQAFQTVSQEKRVWQDAMEAKREASFILYDPQFRTLRDLLEPDVAKNLYASLKETSPQTVELVNKTYFMKPTDKNIVEQVSFIAKRAAEIGESLSGTADQFADAFAALDRKLTKES